MAQSKKTKQPPSPPPPLIEVVCELYFDYAEGQGWDNSYSGKLLMEIQNEYSKFEPQNEVGLAIGVGKDGSVTPQVLPSRTRYRYIDNKGNSIFLSKNSIAVSLVTKETPYTWPNFKTRIYTCWEHTINIVPINRITRVGLRYINHIKLLDGELPSKYLSHNSEHVPKSLLNNNENFALRYENKSNNGTDVLGVSLVLTQIPNTEKNTIIFDIDRICRSTIPNPSQKNINETLEKLHTEIEDIFFSSITDDLRISLR